MWTASAATIAVLAAWLLLAPLPFRTPAQAVDDLVVWSQGMLFTYNSHGIAQRPFRSYSYKNQSIMALMHRLLRDVPADGESVLSRRARAALPGPGRRRDYPPVDPSTDLLTFLKPHVPAGYASALIRCRDRRGEPRAWPLRDRRTKPRGGKIPSGRRSCAACRVESQHCRSEFSRVTVITVAAMLGLCLFVVAVLPPRNRRTHKPMPLSLPWSPC